MTDSDSHLIDTDYEEFSKHKILNSHLAEQAFRGLAKNCLRKRVVDLAQGRKELSGGMILAVALSLAELWRDRLPEKRVGVVFPAGLGGILVNLALVFLDKIPVNLNFTAGANTLDISMKMAGVKTVITAKPVIDKVPDFPWPEQIIDLVAERKGIDKKKVIAKLGLIAVLPAGMLLKRFNIPTEGGDKEAGLLFSSGSTGRPKGILLTHKNVLGNCLQIEDCELLNHEQTLLACLPIFHSFGFTACLWYPLITGLKIVTSPSPLETKKIADAIEAEKATVLMGTPTFFRPYFKRIEVSKLASLNYVIAGAEKTPPEFAKHWEEHFGSRYLEGYGLTETSPVVSINCPATSKEPERVREGSVGKLMVGMQARVTHPSSGEALALGERGILELKGPNIFPHYLDDEESTRAAFNGEWFVTNDLARFDEDDYIYIEGRISRFSKIGGEMVPHGKIEQVIAEAFELSDAETPMVAVTGISDEQKGEALVLLSAVDIKSDLLRKRLMDKGLPNLWIPKIIHRVDAIPCLASGKLDLQALGRLAIDPQKFRD